MPGRHPLIVSLLIFGFAAMAGASCLEGPELPFALPSTVAPEDLATFIRSHRE